MQVPGINIKLHPAVRPTSAGTIVLDRSLNLKVPFSLTQLRYGILVEIPMTRLWFRPVLFIKKKMPL